MRAGTRRVYSALESASLDAQGKLLGVPVVNLIGGRVRERVPYSAYLFYKWGAHPATGSRPAIHDEWAKLSTRLGSCSRLARWSTATGLAR